MTEADLKTILDIGLGALSIVLWFKQVKVNRLQMDLDTKQNLATQDLTTMVRDHDDRINRLEHNSVNRKTLNKKLAVLTARKEV